MAGSLQRLGGVIGVNVDTHRDAHNEKGYFENLNALYANEELLRLAGSCWDAEDALPMGMADDPRYDMSIMRMGDFFARDMELAEGSFLIVKDPRIGLLLPLYLKVFRGLGVEPSFLFCDRRDDEIVESLRIRDDFDRSHTVAMTATHRQSVQRFEDEIDVVWVSTFDCLFKKMTPFFRWLAVRFDLPLTLTAETLAAVDNFLETGLQHHKAVDWNGLWGTEIIRDPVSITIPDWALLGSQDAD